MAKMKTNKFTVMSAGNDGFRYRYDIRKKESFGKSFNSFLIDLGFNKKDVEGWCIDPNTGENIKIKDMRDWVTNYKNKNFDVDVFYSSKEIILVIRTKNRKKLITSLEKYSYWLESKKKKSKKNKNKK